MPSPIPPPYISTKGVMCYCRELYLEYDLPLTLSSPFLDLKFAQSQKNCSNFSLRYVLIEQFNYVFIVLPFLTMTLPIISLCILTLLFQVFFKYF